MKNLSINLRLALMVVTLGVRVIAMGVVSLFGMETTRRAQHDAYAVHFAAVVALGKSGTAMSRALWPRLGNGESIQGRACNGRRPGRLLHVAAPLKGVWNAALAGAVALRRAAFVGLGSHRTEQRFRFEERLEPERAVFAADTRLLEPAERLRRFMRERVD